MSDEELFQRRPYPKRFSEGGGQKPPKTIKNSKTYLNFFSTPDGANNLSSNHFKYSSLPDNLNGLKSPSKLSQRSNLMQHWKERRKYQVGDKNSMATFLNTHQDKRISSSLEENNV